MKSAVGFNPDRGDQLTVQNIPFQDTSDLGVEEAAKWWSNPFFISLIKNLLIGLGFLLLMLLVIRPLLASLRIMRPARLESFTAEIEEPEQLTAEQRALLAQQTAQQQSLMDMAKKEPYQVAQVLQNWIEEDNK